MAMTIELANCGSYEFEDGDFKGAGSYSYVYLARGRGDASPSCVAVKLMKEAGRLSDELLEREYHYLCQLEASQAGPRYVPRVYGLCRIASNNDLNGRLALAMEYLNRREWPPLRDLLNEIADSKTTISAISGVWVARLGKSLLQAAGSFHKRGVVHRDLSDTNVRIRRADLNNPQVTIIDFGVAGQAQRLVKTPSGELLTRGFHGTTLFESPELREGVSSTMLEYRNKPATDLFSIGALLVYARISMEYGCKAATKAMEQSGRFAYQLVPLLNELRPDADKLAHAITLADMELGDIARTLTKYQPTARHFEQMSARQRMELLLKGQVENAVGISLGDGFALEDALADSSIAQLVQQATPMTFGSISQRCAIVVTGEDVKTPPCPPQGHGWLHADGTLVLVSANVDVRGEQLREEYSHGAIVKEWESISMRDAASSHPWTDEACATTITSVVAPVMIGSGAKVVRLQPYTMHGWFEGLSNARHFDLAGIDTASVVDMASLFRGCSSLVELRLPPSWSYANVTSMERMCFGCRSLREMSFLARTSSNLVQLDTMRVRNFRKLFEGCVRLGEDVSDTLTCLLDTSGAQYLDSMFSGCASLHCLNLRGFDTDGVTGFSSMFEGCSSLAQLQQSFSMRSARWSESMFRGCSSIEEVVLPPTDPKSLGEQPHRTHPANMFSGCSSLKKVELGGLLDHPFSITWHLFADCVMLKSVSVVGMDSDGAQDMGGMFAGCESLEQVEGISDLQTGSATTFGMMFSGCQSLKQLDLSRWDTSSLRTISHMFRDCTSLETLDISGWDTSSVTAVSYAFDGANPSMNVIIGGDLEFPQIRDESQYVKFAPPEFARRFDRS